MQGVVLVFLRRREEPLPAGRHGSVGWAFQAPDGFVGGAVALLPKPDGPPPAEAVWTRRLRTLPELLHCMRQQAPPYVMVKTIAVPHANPAAASLAAVQTPDLSAADADVRQALAVLTAYGVQGLPALQEYPRPVDWFIRLTGAQRYL